MGTYKDEHGTTKVGDFLRESKVIQFLKKNAPHILEVTGKITGVNALEYVGELISYDQKMTEAQKVKAFELLNLDMKDRANARDMQKTALNQTDKFSKRFIYFLAAFWSFASIIYIYLASFTTIVNPDIANTVLGFLLGTIISTIINFFYGSSMGSKDKTKLMLTS